MQWEWIPNREPGDQPPKKGDQAGSSRATPGSGVGLGWGCPQTQTCVGTLQGDTAWGHCVGTLDGDTAWGYCVGTRVGTLHGDLCGDTAWGPVWELQGLGGKGHGGVGHWWHECAVLSSCPLRHNKAACVGRGSDGSDAADSSLVTSGVSPGLGLGTRCTCPLAPSGLCGDRQGLAGTPIPLPTPNPARAGWMGAPLPQGFAAEGERSLDSPSCAGGLELHLPLPQSCFCPH